MGFGLHRSCLDHGSRRRFFLLWSSKTKKCALYDISKRDDTCSRLIPSGFLEDLFFSSPSDDRDLVLVVYLGILFDI